MALLERFQAFCIPRQNVIMERFNFSNRSQRPGESLTPCMAALWSLAATCEFPDRENMPRDRIVMGLRDHKIQQYRDPIFR